MRLGGEIAKISTLHGILFSNLARRLLWREHSPSRSRPIPFSCFRRDALILVLVFDAVGFVVVEVAAAAAAAIMAAGRQSHRKQPSMTASRRSYCFSTKMCECESEAFIRLLPQESKPIHNFFWFTVEVVRWKRPLNCLDLTNSIR